MTWAWEYNPDEKFVTDGVSAQILARIEEKAAELVRAASVLYLDGTTYQEAGEKLQSVAGEDFLFWYSIIPRQERVYILRIITL